MSQQGPILVVSSDAWPSFVTALDEAKMFPVIQTGWADAARAITQVQPTAVLAAMSGAVEARFAALAEQIAARKPYLPLIAVEPKSALPENAVPFTQGQSQGQGQGNVDRLVVRLRAALRIRALHSAVLRRLEDEDDGANQIARPRSRPRRDRTAARTWCRLPRVVRRALASAWASSARSASRPRPTTSTRCDLDGIVLGEGFTARVVHAFLTVLAEDARFRNVPVVLTSAELAPTYDLPNLEIILGDPAHVACNALPLIRQHAFEAQLSRMLRTIEAGGLLDPANRPLDQNGVRPRFRDRRRADQVERRWAIGRPLCL